MSENEETQQVQAEAQSETSAVKHSGEVAEKPAPTVRAKFQATSKHQHIWSNAITYDFTPVGDDGIPEHRRFHKYTPGGKLELTVDNPDVNFELGKHYYLDFTPAD